MALSDLKVTLKLVTVADSLCAELPLSLSLGGRKGQDCQKGFKEGRESDVKVVVPDPQKSLLGAESYYCYPC